MKRIFAVSAALLTLTLSLAYATPAFADLKSVVTAICDAYTNTIVKADGPSPSGPSTGTAFVGQDCGGFMVSMDKAGWHVIHDMRTGGAWYVSVAVTGPCPPGDACYELIFLRD